MPVKCIVRTVSSMDVEGLPTALARPLTLYTGHAYCLVLIIAQ